MAQFGASNKCATCDKPVYFSEQVRALDKCRLRRARGGLLGGAAGQLASRGD